MPDPEDNVAGGRLLGTQHAQQAVDSLTSAVKKLTDSLAAATTRLQDAARGSRSPGDLARSSWNAGSNWLKSNPNAGQVTWNGQASDFGLRDAGIRFPTGQIAGPTGRTSPVNYGERTAGMLGAGIPNGGGPSRMSTFMRGGGGAGGGAVGLGVAAMNWGSQYTGDFVGSNLVGVQAANVGANGGNWNAAVQARLTNQAYGLGLADRQQAQASLSSTLGRRAFNGGFDPSMRAGGFLNPTMSAQTQAGVQQTFASAPFFNRSLMYGIRTMNQQGQARSTYDVNADYARLLGVNGGMTSQQLQASFAMNSRAMVSLRSQGWTPDQLAMFQSQGQATARIMGQGGTSAEAKRLFEAAGGVGRGARVAQDTLQNKYGFTTSDMQQLKGQAAAADDARTGAIKGFSAGLNAASNAVEQFTNAVQRFLQIPGVGTSVGAAAGGGSILRGATSSASPVVGGVASAFGWNMGRRMLSRLGGGAEDIAPRVGQAGGAAGRYGGGKLLGIAGMGAYAWKQRPWGPNGVPILGGGQNVAQQREEGPSVGGFFRSLNPFGGEGGGPGDGGADPNKIVAKAAAISASGKNFGLGRCQYFVRTTMGAPGGASTAAAAWQAAKYKHPGDMNPPPGASVFWTGGSTGAGHTAVSAGGGKVYSTDVYRAGKVDLTTIDWINQHWKSEHYAGWAEDNNGVRVNVGSSTALSGAATGSAAGPDPTSGGANARSAGAPALGASISNYGSVNESEAVAGALGASISGSNASAGGTTSGSNNAGGSTGSVSAAPVNLSGNQSLVQQMAAARGWKGAQWDALYALVNSESSFSNTAKNPKSSAFGMFQFLDSTWGGHKKTSDPKLQTQYGLDYIASRYGDPSKAWSFHQKNNWYDKGAWDITQDQGAVVHKGEMIIPARQADTIRSALQKDAGTQSATGTGVTVNFHRGAVVFHVEGAMDDASVRKAAKQFASFLAEDDRLQKMGTGR